MIKDEKKTSDAVRIRPAPLRSLHARLSQTPLRVPILWLRHREIRPADVFLASYPRSGSTWVRFTIYEALTGKPSEFAAVNESFRVIGEHFEAPKMLPQKGRFIGTHEQYRPAYQRAIYLVRDIRDVALSQYARECEKGIAPPTFDNYLIDLLSGRRRHGAWHDHVLSWLDSRLSGENLLVMYYENIRANPEVAFTKIMDFLGTSCDASTLRRAIQNNSLEEMRSKEDRLNATSTAKVVKRPVRRSTEEDGRFVRRGLVGGWRGRLTDSQQRLIERYAGKALRRAGYLLEFETPKGHDLKVDCANI